MGMDLEQAYATYLPWIEAELRAVLAGPDDKLARHYGMMQYHLGWLDVDLQPTDQPTGKRIRPVLCLMCCAACGGDPRQAVPVAAGLELIHNFSLLHDDIEDDSLTRRHRPAAWTVFGVAMACNAGDAMFSLSHRALHGLSDRSVAPEDVLQVIRIVDDMSIALTEGQYLDMSFEARLDVEPAEYFRMIQGKTAAMLAAAAESGAVVAGGSERVVAACRRYAEALGMAFQLQDDVLGIWGAEEVTGKSAASDILSKKKSLPVIYALADPNVGSRLRTLYGGRPFTDSDVPTVLSLLDTAGAREYTESRVGEATAEAHEALRSAGAELPQDAQAPLHELLDVLLARRA